MKHLLGLLLVAAMVGCGDSAVTAPAIENNQGNSRGAVADTSQESTTDDSVAALEKLGARIERNKKGEVVGVAFSGFSGTQITTPGWCILGG